MATLSAKVETKSSVAATAKKLVRLLCALDIHVSGQSELIIDYATARRRDEPISTAPTEGTLQWLLHRWMAAQQQMRWSPRGAHLMLKVRTSVTNDTLESGPEPFDGISMTCSVAGDRYSWYAANKTKQFQWQHPWWYPQVVEMTANASGQTLR